VPSDTSDDVGEVGVELASNDAQHTTRKRCCAAVPCHHRLCSLLEQVTIVSGHRELTLCLGHHYYVLILRALVLRDRDLGRMMEEG
jgi:hypothetical protein